MWKIRTIPASPSCSAACSEPSARNGCAASSNADTKPAKLPIPPSPSAARHPANPITSATAVPPSTSSSGSSRERLRVICISARYMSWNACRARAVSTASSRYARTVRACAKLWCSSAAVSPSRSCIPPEARRMRLPSFPIGTAASGYISAAIRHSAQSI